MKPFLAYLLLISLAFYMLGCKSKESTVERTKTSDTLITKSFDYKSEPIKTNYSFRLECDSLGNVKPINLNETSGQNQTNLSINDNILNAQLLTGLSQFKADTIYKTKYKNVYQDKEKKVFVTDWKTIIILSLLLFISILANAYFIWNKLTP